MFTSLAYAVQHQAMETSSSPALPAYAPYFYSKYVSLFIDNTTRSVQAGSANNCCLPFVA